MEGQAFILFIGECQHKSSNANRYNCQIYI